jgi:hypothetical protein
MDLLDFTKLETEPFDVIDALFKYEFISNTHVLKALAKALEDGAMISGGFACRMFNASRDPLTEKDVMKKYVHKFEGDVDIYFPSIEVERVFRQRVDSSRNNQPTTRLTFDNACATTWRPRQVGGLNVVLQAVNAGKFPVQTCDELWKTFDISNACIGINKSGFVIPQGYRELNEKGLLHVRDFKYLWVANRMRKWFSKHDNLSELHAECIDDFNSFLLKAFIELKVPKYTPVGEVTQEKFVESLLKRKSFSRHVMSSTLTLLSVYKPPSNYNFALKELMSRSPVLTLNKLVME